MKHLAILVATLAAAVPLAAQQCLFLPADTPTLGTPDPRPFGSGNPSDPTYGTMRYQVQVPAAVLAQAQDIVEIFVAPAGSHTRTFTEFQVRMGHNPNGMGAAMVTNMVGFTSRPVQYNQWTFDTAANEWLPLGMAFPFHYDPQFGDLVLEFFVRQAAAAPGGAGDLGLRTDPSIPFVWTSGQGYNGTIETGGGIKLRLCTDVFGVVEYGVGGCVGSNGLRPTLGYSGSPQMGSTLDIEVEDGPPGAGVAILVHSFVPRIGPLDLTGIGMTGCDARVFGNVLSTVLTNNGAGSLPVSLPIGLQPGLCVWNQWFHLDLPANPFGLTCSTLGRWQIGS
ncbi:MAG: hypothetical protein H6835_12580 [Planctomycetes bacterium]|nr:hypothetical protein [Planctomycetota bacterium]